VLLTKTCSSFRHPFLRRASKMKGMRCAALVVLALFNGSLVSQALPSRTSGPVGVSTRCSQPKTEGRSEASSTYLRRRHNGRHVVVRKDCVDVLGLNGGAVATSDKAQKFKRQCLFAITYLSYVGIYFARKPMSVLKPVLQEEMGMTRAGLGLVDTAMLAAYAMGQIALGQVTRFVSTRTLLTLSFLVSGICTALMGTCQTSNGMAGFAAVTGLASSPANPLLVLLVADLFPPHMRASVVGLWQTSAQVGGIAANNLAAAVLGLKGWRAVLFLCGALVASFALPMNLAVAAAGQRADEVLDAEEVEVATATAAGPEITEETETTAAETTASSEEAAATAAPAATAATDEGAEGEKKGDAAAAAAVAVASAAPSPVETLKLPGVASAGSAYALVKMVRYCLMLWLPTFFRQKVGMSPANAGAMASLFDAGGVAGGVCAGIITDTMLHGHMVATAALMSAGAGAAFLAWAALLKAGGPSGGSLGDWFVPLNAVAMYVAGFLVAGPDGILGGAVSKNICEYNKVKGGGWAPAVSGMVNGLASLAVIVMSAYTAKAVEVLGWDGLYVLLGLLCVAAAALAYPAIVLELSFFAPLSAQE